MVVRGRRHREKKRKKVVANYEVCILFICWNSGLVWKVGQRLFTHFCCHKQQELSFWLLHGCCMCESFDRKIMLFYFIYRPVILSNKVIYHTKQSSTIAYAMTQRDTLFFTCTLLGIKCLITEHSSKCKERMLNGWVSQLRHLFPSLFIRREEPHFKAAQPGIPSGHLCNLQADTNHTLGPTQVV